MKTGLYIDASYPLAAFKKAPDLMTQHVSQKIHRAAEELAREMKRLAPKAESTLVNSIRAVMISPLKAQVGPGVDYAPAVEEGAGPGGSPSYQSLLDWIRRKGISPRKPDHNIDDLIYLIGASIRHNGTPAQPFVEPAYEAKRDRMLFLINQGVSNGVAAVGS